MRLESATWHCLCLLLKAPIWDLPTPWPHTAPALPTPDLLRMRDQPGPVKGQRAGGLMHGWALPLSEDEEGKEGLGKVCSAVGSQRAGAVMRNGPPPWPGSLFLIVLAHCTGDWMQRQGKGPCFLLLSLDPSLILSVSSSSRVLGPVCADSAAIFSVWVPGPDTHRFLHWKPSQHRGRLVCVLVPTAPKHDP